MISEYLHYGTIALAAAINALGAGIGSGITSNAALRAINIQPSARAEIIKASVLGMALIETAAIMGVSIAFILLFGSKGSTSAYAGIAETGIALAICLPGFFIGLISSLPAQQACLSIARQPFFSRKILRFMLITQSVIQTPVVSGFIIAMFIRNEIPHITSYAESIKLLASGLCIGLGSVGPALGLGYFAQTACRSIGVNRNAYGKLLSFTLVSQAIIETSIIFALVIALLIFFASKTITLLGSIALLSAALCTGLGTIGAGISSGKSSAAACEQIALHPEQYPILSRVSMIAQGLIDTCAIYALVISILLILWV